MNYLYFKKKKRPNSAPSERKGEAYANSGHKEANLVGGLLIKI